MLHFLLLLPVLLTGAVEPGTAGEVAEVVEETIPFVEQIVAFFESESWLSIVGTVSSGGLVGTIIALLKKNKNIQSYSEMGVNFNNKTKEIAKSVQDTTAKLTNLKDEVTTVFEKVDMLIASLGILVAGLPLKAEYKAQFSEALNKLSISNADVSKVIAKANELSKEIVAAAKEEATKEVTETTTELENSYDLLRK